ncbi:MAG: glycosyltransferase [Vicinamibacterales bacterium]|nr:glycosyltransferase [Vicinamibacterales bacterium]
MTTGLDVMLAAAGLPVLAAAGYLLALTALWRRPAPAERSTGGLRFCVLVPAHNEARGIGATIRSLRAADYPAAHLRLVVVADNCSDDTAAEAEAHGAEVLVRSDEVRRGKGYALQFGIAWALRETGRHGAWDALAVIDADTVVDAGLFHGLARRIEAGASAVQAAYLPRPGRTHATAVITHVAFVAFHLVRSAARERLGLSCGLRGNGMAFRRSLLGEVAHDAFSRTEDLEFGIQLGLRGVRVVFACDARVYGDMPDARGAVRHQRERWMGGRAAIAKRFVGALFSKALRERSAVAADLAVDVLIPPVSALAAVALAGFVAGTALDVATAARGLAEAVWGAALAAIMAHVTHAAWVSGHGAAFARAAFAVPGYALDKTITLLRVVGRADETWVRTPREGER